MEDNWELDYEDYCCLEFRNLQNPNKKDEINPDFNMDIMHYFPVQMARYAYFRYYKTHRKDSEPLSYADAQKAILETFSSDFSKNRKMEVLQLDEQTNENIQFKPEDYDKLNFNMPVVFDISGCPFVLFPMMDGEDYCFCVCGDYSIATLRGYSKDEIKEIAFTLAIKVIVYLEHGEFFAHLTARHRLGRMPQFMKEPGFKVTKESMKDEEYKFHNYNAEKLYIPTLEDILDE